MKLKLDNFIEGLKTSENLDAVRLGIDSLVVGFADGIVQIIQKHDEETATLREQLAQAQARIAELEGKIEFQQQVDERYVEEVNERITRHLNRIDALEAQVAELTAQPEATEDGAGDGIRWEFRLLEDDNRLHAYQETGNPGNISLCGEWIDWCYNLLGSNRERCPKCEALNKGGAQS